MKPALAQALVDLTSALERAGAEAGSIVDPSDRAQALHYLAQAREDIDLLQVRLHTQGAGKLTAIVVAPCRMKPLQQQDPPLTVDGRQMPARPRAAKEGSKP